MLWKRHTILIMLVVVVIGSVVFLEPAPSNGTPTQSKLALMMVASLNTTNNIEFEKSNSFYNHLINEGYSDTNIQYFSYLSIDNVDYLDTMENIENAFDNLYIKSNPHSEVVIYISDSGHGNIQSEFFNFHNCNITITQLQTWMDNIICHELTLISNGNRSGIVGPELYSSGRTIISSMEEDETAIPDNFNITRSLNDINSDTNNDNIITYSEAFYRERDYYLVGYNQNPQIWL